jgi:lysophospholipase L1-like esterase
MKNLFLKSSLSLLFIIGSFVLNAQDWANLHRYQQENDSILALSSNKNKVVFMGNSITEFWKENHPDFFIKNSYLDRGISGQTTPQMLIRFRQDVINLKPKVVVILAGTNDFAGNTGPSTLEMMMNNIASMAELAKMNGIQPVLCSDLPAYDYPWHHGMEPNIKIPKLNEMIKAYAMKKGFLYVDYFKAMSDEKNAMFSEYTTDGVHCTLKGYEKMESIVVPAIEKALKRK